MAETDAWRILTKGDDDQGIVLAVDFDVTGRVEARFSDLAKNLDTGYAIWETVPPPVRTDHTWTGSDYVNHWARQAGQAARWASAANNWSAVESGYRERIHSPASAAKTDCPREP